MLQRNIVIETLPNINIVVGINTGIDLEARSEMDLPEVKIILALPGSKILRIVPDY
ncbi:MAG: hypothetical protein V3V73_00355 [Gammaproteobacteria bacterium]